MKHRIQLNSIISSMEAKLVILTETWLNSTVENTEIFQTDVTYDVYRCDREDRQGGGVLIAVSQTISSFQVEVVSSLETVWVGISSKHTKIILGVCYRPPNYTSSFVDQLHDVLSYVVTRYPSSPIFLFGDMNFPNITWHAGVPLLDPFSTQSQQFLDFCNCFNFTQVVTKPTRVTNESSNTLDLVLSTHPDFISPIIYLPGLSDHLVLHFDITMSFSRGTEKDKYIRDYRNADFDAINQDMCAYLDTFCCNFEERSVQENWDLFKNLVTNVTNAHIPLRRIRNNTKRPWYNTHLKRLSNRKKRYFRTAKLQNTSDCWVAYQNAEAEYVEAVRAAKNRFQTHTLPELLSRNPRQFWNVINSSQNADLSINDDSGEPLPPSECAALFNNIFSANFSGNTAAPVDAVVCRDYRSMFPIIFDSAGILKLIDTLKTSSSCGTDGINSKFLKQTSAYSSLFLCKIFQQSLDQATLPLDWKVGKVVPIHKSGDKHSALNYRPISLTSIPCKLMEHVLHSHIAKLLESNSFFTSAQHGFRRTFSCETQLLLFTHHLHTILDKQSLIDCIFLDFAKAFEKVNHALLMHKLSSLNLDSNVLAWLNYFLTNRLQYVTVNGHDSPEISVTSGVPQGSVLGPLLFLIYINDLPDCVSSSVHLYADDCVLYREIRTDDDRNILQTDLNNIRNWCDKWLMKLNPKKCKLMTVSRQPNNSSTYKLGDVYLDQVSSYRYLGVTISFNLTWNAHINVITNNANRTLGYIRRNFSNAPLSLKMLLYKTLVRSKLEYAAAIWNPHHENLIRHLELIQNNAARFILSDYHRTSSVTAMKHHLSLPPLSLRRKYFRLCLFHKTYHHPSLRNELITPPTYHSSRIDHEHKVKGTFCYTNTFSCSFIPVTSNDWNRLPGDIVSISDHSLFRHSLSAHLFRDSSP